MPAIYRRYVCLFREIPWYIFTVVPIQSRRQSVNPQMEPMI